MKQKVFESIVFMVSCVIIQEVLNLKLESDKSIPIRGNSLILSCLTSKLFDSGVVYWYNPNHTELSRCYSIHGRRCRGNTSSYSFTANDSGSYAYIHRLNRAKDGGNWTCVHSFLDSYAENDTKDIVVYASPSGVSFVQPIPPDGDLGMDPITLKCQTDSCAFPAPSIMWYYMTDGLMTPYLGLSDNTTSNTSLCSQQEAIYTKTLQLPQGTNFTGNVPFITKFICGVTHQSLGSDVKYSNTSNHVRFAVQVSMINLVDSASGTKVFYEGFPQTLKCVSSPSRPVPAIKWLLHINDTIINLSGNITETYTTDINDLHMRSSEITLTLRRDQTDQKIFCAGNIHGQPAVESNAVQIDVLYQASQPIISEKDEKFPWKENQTGILRCNTTNYGNPTSKVIWNSHRGTTDRDENLVIEGLTSQDNGKIVSCSLDNNYTVEKNVMVISEHVTLNIEYSPIIELNTTSPLTVNETHSISVLCRAKGNPEPNSTVWIGRSDSVLRFNNISRKDNGTYTCLVISISTKHETLSRKTVIDILVQYAPDLNVTITGSDHQNMTSNVTCEVSGFPSKYTFHPWKHMFDEVTIRSHLHGNPESTTNSSKNILKLDRLSLRDMGTYVCSADNGIRGINGDIKQTGTVVLNVKGKPDVVNRKDDTFAGEIGSLVNMTIPFYSDPVIVDFKFKRNGSEVKNTSKTTMYLRKDIVELMFYNTKIKLKVQTANMLIQNLTKADFNDYILVLENALGQTEFKLKLEALGHPQTVEQFYYNRFIEGGIEFHFDPGFNGGRKQTFVIEYRSMNSPEDIWKNTSIVDLQEEQTEYQLPNGTYFVNVTRPPPGDYLYRIYSQNDIGRSPYSMKVSVLIPQGEKTKPHSNPLVAVVAGSIVTALVVVLTVVVTLILVKKRFLSTRKSRGACQSRELIHRRRLDIDAVYQNYPIRNANANTDNVYENALAVQRFGDNSHDDDANVYENGFGVDMNLLRHNGILIYADLDLTNPTTNNGKPIIHGLENRTEYAEIAFGKRGEPLPDSDDEQKIHAVEGAN